MSPETGRRQPQIEPLGSASGATHSSDSKDAAEPWRRLQRNLLNLLAHPPLELWAEVWHLFLEDPWYLAERDRHARWTIRTARAPPDWTDELIQESVLYLASELQKRPDLGLDQLGFGEEFPRRIGKMARNDCRQALKRMRRLYGTPPDAVRLQEKFQPDLAIELSLALQSAMAELPEPEASVIRLYFANFRIGEIAERLGLTYWEARRAFWNAIQQLRDDLS